MVRERSRPTAPRSFVEASVAELRRYVLHPGGLDVLRELFAAHFVAGQQDAGMLIGGIFTDDDRPDRFVWWRGFADMTSRHESLEAFYGGPVWSAHSRRANATMIDSDDVVLLRHTVPPRGGPTPQLAPTGSATAAVIVRHDDAPGTEERLSSEGYDRVRAAFGVDTASWRTEPAPNTFEGLPVRPEPVVVYVATWSTATERDDALRRLDDDGVLGGLDVDILRLRPVLV